MPQLSDVIFSDFRSSKKNVNRLFLIGILFCLVGHFYVVEPYFQYRIQERKAKDSLARVTKRQEEVSGRLDRLTNVSRKAISSLEEIRNEIRRFPDSLRNTLPEIDNAWRAAQSLQRSPTDSQALQADPSQSVAQQYQQQTDQSFQQYQMNTLDQAGRIVLPPDITTFEDGVIWYIETWFARLIEKLEREVANPVLELEGGRKDAGGSALEKTTHEAVGRLRAYLDGVDRGFWRSYGGRGGKLDVANTLQQVLEESFGPVKTDVFNLLKQTEETGKDLQGQSAAIENELKGYDKHIEELASRITSLESPLGPIPLGLTELIILFPILVVMLVAMLAVALRKSGKLYILSWRQIKLDEGDVDFSLFQSYADCWYLPPYGGFALPLLIFAWMALILGIFVRAALLVMGEPDLFISLGGLEQSFKQGLFRFAYLVGSMVMIGSVWFGGNALRVASHELKGEVSVKS